MNNKSPFVKHCKPAVCTLSVTAMLFGILVISPSAIAQEEQQYSSVEERRIYDSIVEERDNLKKEREDITLRKMELKTLEEGVDKKLAELDGKLAELKKLQDRIASLLQEKTADETQKRKDLASIYEKMDPGKAAMAMSGLDPQLAAELLANMKVKSAAKVLDASTKQKATELSTRFSTIQLE